MRSYLLIPFLVVLAAGAARAQYAPGSIGNGGRMPETMSPGALPPPPTISRPPAPAPAPSTSLGARYPNTESMARDRVESRGYQVDRMTRQPHGSWTAHPPPDALPTLPPPAPHP